MQQSDNMMTLLNQVEDLNASCKNIRSNNLNIILEEIFAVKVENLI